MNISGILNQLDEELKLMGWDTQHKIDFAEAKKELDSNCDKAINLLQKAKSGKLDTIAVETVIKDIQTLNDKVERLKYSLKRK